MVALLSHSMTIIHVPRPFCASYLFLTSNLSYVNRSHLRIKRLLANTKGAITGHINEYNVRYENIMYIADIACISLSMGVLAILKFNST